MRVPRVQFTVRRMMFAVAVVAILLFTLVAGTRMHRKRAFCLRQAAVAALTEANWKARHGRTAALLASCEDQRSSGNPAEAIEQAIHSLRAELSPLSLKAEYYARVRRNWEYAAAHPWFPVEPNPPEPK
jgi:hypothetical protein